MIEKYPFAVNYVIALLYFTQIEKRLPTNLFHLQSRIFAWILMVIEPESVLILHCFKSFFNFIIAVGVCEVTLIKTVLVGKCFSRNSLRISNFWLWLPTLYYS